MAIQIECAQCHQSYRVADGLMGKKVKCRNCGTPIDVRPAPETLELAPDDPSAGGVLTRLAETNAGIPSLPPLEAPEPVCPQCNAPVARGAKICVNCGWGAAGTGGGSGMGEAPSEADSGLTNLMKNRRWVRKRGSRSLENLDELIKYVVYFMGLAGTIIWGVRIGLGPGGFTVQAILPILVVLGLVVLVIAPLVAWGVNKAVVMMKLAPREDMYARVLAVMLLPLATAMIAGCPGLNGQLDFAIPISWVLTPVLLAFFLRADLLEWVVSMGVAAGAFLAGFLLTGLGAGAISKAAGPLHRDMLPQGGPWLSLATGHSPERALPTPTVNSNDVKPVPATATAPSEPAPSNTQIASVPTAPAPVNPTPGETTPTPGATTPPPAAANHSSTPGETAPIPAAPAELIQSPLLHDIVVDHPAMLNVSDISGSSQSSYVLISRNLDATTSSVERWSTMPLEKRGEVVYQQLPTKQNQYLLGPKGDWLVALTVFPRYQLQFYNFDTKITKKAVPLEQGQGTGPQLVGFIDQNQFLIRDGADLYFFNIVSGKPNKMKLESPPDEGSSIAISRNGKIIAMFTADQKIAVYNVDYPGSAPRRITPGNISLKCANVAFSPDSTQVAVYGIVSEMPSILAFKVNNGDLISTALVPPEEGVPIHGTAEKPAIKHGLMWLGNGQTWILNGRYVIDTATGRRLGVLDIPNLVDQLSVGTPMGETLMFLVQGEDKKRRIVTASLDESKLKAAREKMP